MGGVRPQKHATLMISATLPLYTLKSTSLPSISSAFKAWNEAGAAAAAIDTSKVCAHMRKAKGKGGVVRCDEAGE